MKVREVMTPNPVCCVPTDTAQKVAHVLRDQDVGSVPVVADQQSRKLLGMITDRDICCSVVAEGLDPKGTSIEKYVTAHPVSCRDGENLDKCERAMQEHQIRRIPIVDGEGACIGIVSQADLALKGKPEKVSKTSLRFPNLNPNTQRLRPDVGFGGCLRLCRTSNQRPKIGAQGRNYLGVRLEGLLRFAEEFIPLHVSLRCALTDEDQHTKPAMTAWTSGLVRGDIELPVHLELKSAAHPALSKIFVAHSRAGAWKRDDLAKFGGTHYSNLESHGVGLHRAALLPHRMKTLSLTTATP